MIEDDLKVVLYKCSHCGSVLKGTEISIVYCGGPPEKLHTYALMQKVKS